MPSKILKKVVLLCHGLNNSQSSLNDIQNVIEADDIETGDTAVIRVALSGHLSTDGQLKSGAQNWLKAWIADLREATDQAREIAAQSNAPLHFVGFSLGCLLFLLLLLELELELEENPFEKAVFFAPPLKNNKKASLLNFLSPLWVRFFPNLPSSNEERVRVYKWVPYSMYEALFEATSMLEKNRSRHWNMPILILTDPRDQLVSLSRIRQWISEKQLSWMVIPLLMECPWRLKTPFHLMIDKLTVGASVWKLLSRLVCEFLAERETSIENEARVKLLPITSYEHFFLNEENSDYPISPVIQLVFEGPIDDERLRASVRKAQERHPLTRALVNGYGVQKRKDLTWIILENHFEPYYDLSSNMSSDVKIDMNSNMNLGSEVFPEGRRQIDLRFEVGLRFFIQRRPTHSTIVIQSHHAIADGIGLLQFINDMLLFYFEKKERLPAYPLQLLEQRGASMERSLGLLKWMSDLLLLVQFLLFKPKRVSPPRDTLIEAGRGLYSTFAITELPVDVLTLLKVQSKKLGFTVNDILLFNLLKVIRAWNQKNEVETKSSRNTSKIRITIPVNIRDKISRNTPACHLTDVCFFDQKSEDILLSGLKKKNFSSVFNRITSFAGLFYQGISVLNKNQGPEVCQTTACLSNLGILENIIQISEFRSKELGLELKNIFGSPPLRPGTLINFGVATLKGHLNICILCDPKYFSSKQSQAFLEFYSSEIKLFVLNQEGL